MTLREITELMLALGAVLLLGRDLRRTWLDELRRPVTLFVAAVIGGLLIASFVGRSHPSPWWLILPSGVLAWEVARGWRRAPRSHLWEAAVGAFAASLLFAALGLGMGDGSLAAVPLAISVLAAIVGVGVLRRSHRREPRPWRAGDPIHYERRGAQRQ